MSVVNLNQLRKAKAKAEKKVKADENAVRFGRTKAERELDAARKKAAQSKLDGHRRTPK